MGYSPCLRALEGLREGKRMCTRRTWCHDHSRHTEGFMRMSKRAESDTY